MKGFNKPLIGSWKLKAQSVLEHLKVELKKVGYQPTIKKWLKGKFEGPFLSNGSCVESTYADEWVAWIDSPKQLPFCCYLIVKPDFVKIHFVKMLYLNDSKKPILQLFRFNEPF